MVDIVVVLAEHVETAHRRSLVTLVTGERLEALPKKRGRAYEDPEPSPSWRSWSDPHEVPST